MQHPFARFRASGAAIAALYVGFGTSSDGLAIFYGREIGGETAKGRHDEFDGNNSPSTLFRMS